MSDEPRVCKSKRRVFLVSPDKRLADMLRGLWPPDELEFSVFERGRMAVEYLFNEPPDMLIVDSRLEDLTGFEVAALVKSENVYRQLPVILCMDQADLREGPDWGEVDVDDFLVRPFTTGEAKARLELSLCRSTRSLDANPLTRLPGNTTIIQSIQDLIDRREDFALAYCDLDHFKSFNDRYGFARGDEVLMMSARVIVNSIKGFSGHKTFVGHVGGDDFVFIVPPEIAEEACARVVRSFDSIVPNFYDPADRKLGRIESVNRKGERETFPLMAVSIAVIFNRGGRMKHFGEASALAMGLKKKAKENPGSCYVLDQRRD